MKNRGELGLFTKVGLSAAAMNLVLSACGLHLHHHSRANDSDAPLKAPPPYFVCEAHVRNGNTLDVTASRVNQATNVQTPVKHITSALLEFAGNDPAPQILYPDDNGLASAKIPEGFSQPTVHATVGTNDPVLCLMNDIKK